MAIFGRSRHLYWSYCQTETAGLASLSCHQKVCNCGDGDTLAFDLRSPGCKCLANANIPCYNGILNVRICPRIRAKLSTIKVIGPGEGEKLVHRMTRTTQDCGLGTKIHGGDGDNDKTCKEETSFMLLDCITGFSIDGYNVDIRGKGGLELAVRVHPRVLAFQHCTVSLNWLVRSGL